MHIERLLFATPLKWPSFAFLLVVAVFCRPTLSWAHPGPHGTLDDHADDTSQSVPVSPASSYDTYHVGIDFVDSTIYPLDQFFFPPFQNGIAPFPLTSPSSNFVSQGGLVGWTEEQARRAVALAVEDTFRDIDVGDPNRQVAISFYNGLAEPTLNGQRLNVILGQHSGVPSNLLGTVGGAVNDPASTDQYVAAALLDNIDGLGDSFLTYNTPEGVINSIAGVVAHELGHLFSGFGGHIPASALDPLPFPLLTHEGEGLPIEARLTERRFSTTSPSPVSVAEMIYQNTGLVSRSDLNMDGLVNAIDASSMFDNWGLDARFHSEGDVTGDHLVNAVDAGAMFAAWSADPGPMVDGTAAAEYDPLTGELTVSVNSVVNWYIESASMGLSGDPVDGVTLALSGGAVSDNNQIIGESTGFVRMNYTGISLGNAAEVGLPLGDLTISWNAALGSPLQTIPVLYLPIPEPAAVCLAMIAAVCLGVSRRKK